MMSKSEKTNTERIRCKIKLVFKILFYLFIGDRNYLYGRKSVWEKIKAWADIDR